MTYGWIYSQTEEEQLKHNIISIQKFKAVGIKLKMSKYEFFKSQIEYLGHLVSGKGICAMKQKVQLIMDLVSATSITQALSCDHFYQLL